ncbi:hypothetical protein [Streptomyces sp. NPDC046727]|uniref:hypothetical protein n=1 Tax=Streptomyces sp. NPDC046727 TaxID=3155373 RepID=UPI0033EAF9B9
MGRRGGPPPGVRFLVLGLALPAVLCASGCDRPGRPPDSAHASAAPAPAPTSASQASTASPSRASASPASDAGLCARIVIHWAREVLGGDTYGDYQSMGLSHGQYQILMDVVDAGRAAGRRQGADAADALMARQARRACAERYRHGTPSGGPWT